MTVLPCFLIAMVIIIWCYGWVMELFCDTVAMYWCGQTIISVLGYEGSSDLSLKATGFTID